MKIQKTSSLIRIIQSSSTNIHSPKNFYEPRKINTQLHKYQDPRINNYNNRIKQYNKGNKSFEKKSKI